METKLTAKQRKFCEEYMIDLNATQAAIRAGYSRKTANEIGNQNLAKLSIKNYIGELQQKAKAESGVSIESVIEAYKRLAFFDIRKLFRPNGTMKKITELDQDTAFAVLSFETQGTGKDFLKKVKLADRKAALDSICKVLGFNAAEKKEITGDIVNHNINLTPAEIKEYAKALENEC